MYIVLLELAQRKPSWSGATQIGTLLPPNPAWACPGPQSKSSWSAQACTAQAQAMLDGNTMGVWQFRLQAGCSMSDCE